MKRTPGWVKISVCALLLLGGAPAAQAWKFNFPHIVKPTAPRSDGKIQRSPWGPRYGLGFKGRDGAVGSRGRGYSSKYSGRLTPRGNKPSTGKSQKAAPKLNHWRVWGPRYL